MPPQLDDTDSPLARASRDTGRLLRLSSLECAVSVMVMFGVSVSIVQPIICSTRSSLANSSERLNHVVGPAGPDALMTKTAAHNRNHTKAKERAPDTQLVRDPQPPVRKRPASP